MLSKINPTTTQTWEKLTAHYQQIKDKKLTEFFDEDPLRFETFSQRFKNILIDFSKNQLGKDTMELFSRLFNECKISESIEHQFTGGKINRTENRAVLHTALRNISKSPIYLEGKNVMLSINEVWKQMEVFSNKIINGEHKGYTGKPISDIINVGIGGSDLGPQMVYEALKPYHQKRIKCHYVSNIDGAHMAETLKKVNPETCLFIIASKTFTTQETMTNANSARDWFLEKGGGINDISSHFVAVSTNSEKVVEFGIDPNNMFVFWDWVGGRYSLWSSIGLSLCCGLGFSSYWKLLEGAHEMDIHFRNESFENNIPLQMAAIGIWYTNFFEAESEAILPYDQNMHRFAAYFQQGNMESNGKSVDRNSKKVDYSTGPIIWGEPGTNGQHAFYQLIHQGTHTIPCDFIGFVNSHYQMGDHHPKLMANFFAQTEALMKGKSKIEAQSELEAMGKTSKEINEILDFKVFEGSKPSTSILGEILDEKTLGSLIACYEHKIFAQGIVWNIYSYDQWGVELGKQLASGILPELQNSKHINSHDQSTNGLINYYKELRKPQ